VVDVRFDCVRSHAQSFGDLAVREPLSHQPEDFTLPSGEHAKSIRSRLLHEHRVQLRALDGERTLRSEDQEEAPLVLAKDSRAIEAQAQCADNTGPRLQRQSRPGPMAKL
jgi:hypothetical protein